jgi:hypothetical protein
MRFVHVLLVVSSLMFFGATASADSVIVQSNTDVTLSNCPATGSTATNVPKGEYLFRTFDEDVWVCYDATSCNTGGQRFAPGSVIHVKVVKEGGVMARCRSTSATGDVHFGRIQR